MADDSDIMPGTLSVKSPDPWGPPDEDSVPFLVDLFQSPNEILCEFGDVTLIADDGFHPISKIRVSSCILATASQVFKALFSDKFAEGQALRCKTAGREPVELHMSDCPADLLALCQLLHFRGNVQSMSARKFLGLAVLIDKYDCVESLRPVMQSGLPPCKYDFIQEDLMFYIAAAYLLDDAKGFREFTRELILQSSSVFLRHSDERLAVLPASILPSIQAQRAFVLQKYTRKLLAFTEDYTSAAFALEVPNYSRKLARHISDFELLPPRTSATLRECLERLSTIHVPTMQQDSYPRAQHEMLSQKHWITLNRTSPYGIRAHHSNSGWETWTPPSPRPVSPAYTAPQARIEPPTKKDLEHLIEKIRRSCVGLCLDCVQGNFNCRERHSQRWKGSEALPQDMFWAYDTEAKAAEDDGWWPPGNSPAPSSPRGDF